MPYQVVWAQCNVFNGTKEGDAVVLARGQRVPKDVEENDPVQVERLAVIGAIQFFEEPPAVPLVATAQEVNADLGTQPLPENLDDLTVQQLQEEAAARHIDLGDAKRKDEIIAKLRAA